MEFFEIVITILLVLQSLLHTFYLKDHVLGANIYIYNNEPELLREFNNTISHFIAPNKVLSYFPFHVPTFKDDILIIISRMKKTEPRKS